MNDWIPVNGYKELPVGDWLVLTDLNEPIFDSLVMHTAAIRENVGVIGGLFPFDQRDVIAYRPLPEVPVLTKQDK